LKTLERRLDEPPFFVFTAVRVGAVSSWRSLLTCPAFFVSVSSAWRERANEAASSSTARGTDNRCQKTPTVKTLAFFVAGAVIAGALTGWP
jgi:hypothetical protein